MLKKVTEIAIVPPYGLRVRFNDGSFGVHDCAWITAETGPMAAPLHDPATFARVFLEFGAPSWPNGYDMCPDWLHQQMSAAGELRKEAAE